MNNLLKTMSLGLAGLIASTAVADAQIVLRFNEGGPNRGTRAEALQYFADRVEDLSEGEMKIDINWGGALLKLGDTAEGVGDGIADMGSVIGVYTPNQMLALLVGDLPYGASADAWVGMRAMYDLMTSSPAAQDSLAKQNTVYIANYHTTGLQIECREGITLEKAEDFAGYRMRASGVYGRVLSDLGANLVNMTYDQVYQGYDTGLLDCDAGYFYAIKAYNLHEVIDTVYRADFGQIGGFAIIANRDMYRSLSEEQQGILMTAGSDMIDFFAQLQIQSVDEMIEQLESGHYGKTVSVIDLDPAVRNALLEGTEPYIQDWRTKFTEAGYDGDAIWDQYKSLIDKYTEIRDAEGYPWNR
ncbi:C4-dicarboxylate TRAP transporter substrate-binding protein [Mameliella sediminis]|uniref:C4-dicarboxylate TRAP transporter substrate-binding protein n=1 Tax=Mameliella sediminis TaxID=2836866 RepID=UPI001C44038C|nr:C4-dicarboxylate TRAP transporter substrate-binding protein [Mameliella sediminis]MBY6116032.1 C4-dicarboxylate TRAP transporter substrate-binding protein [Antarctobacter heliothermus]MBY6145190.1 C4-dicarboxylate TRAP transporter substrate-binding protein [Mameliella alba]MBV7394071.1 C4-dicarboxylate TRAP transporter substrate-binding protein [Mameliella sediminis]MBY6162015.1 C4-dicarboxylate TRAP transporter substrate-binding protein [Mameliella alba]MBY6170485.1 C4-dicarboxylate TRAP t